MKHLRLFESFEGINSICSEYDIKNYTINSDGTVDVDGGVNLRHKGLSKLPLKFGIVNGYFDCSYNQLTSLEGSPKEVHYNFFCVGNQLTTLEGGPSYVGRNFDCTGNLLTTLKGSPREIGGNFNCISNQLVSLEGYSVSNNFFCDFNPVHNIRKLFPDHKSFIDSLDYNYLRGTDIVRSRLQEACEEVGIRMPEKIEGYNYI